LKICSTKIFITAIRFQLLNYSITQLLNYQFPKMRFAAATITVYTPHLSMDQLRSQIEQLYANGTLAPEQVSPARQLFQQFRDALTKGKIRAAEKSNGHWRVNAWVKQGILLGFRLGELDETSAGALSFVDKDTFPARRFAVADRVRLVPGGSSIRQGAYVAPGVICMPPMYINVGAYVDEGALVDSHALVGSCAQIGKRVHLSAAAQVGGVLEPVNASPVIIEDDVLVGGNCGIYEGTQVRSGAVLGAGVILTRATPVYDIVREQVYRSSAETPLVIPENAVVIPGSRGITRGKAAEWGLALYTPVIVKYRDEKTQSSIELEDLLR
jgi:2,3,4,5-tetrahydropyridine-2-carboxylate N-succinyltransferase